MACAISRIRLNGPGNDISAITLMVTAQYCISSVQIVCLNVCLSIFNLIVHSVYINLENKTLCLLYLLLVGTYIKIYLFFYNLLTSIIVALFELN